MKKNILIFLIGFFCGVLFLNLLCMNALRVQKNIIKSELSAEQQMLAQRAERKGDYTRALIHRWNVVDLASPDGFRVFRDKKSKKDNLGFLFLFHAITLRQMEKRIDPRGKGRKINEGIERARLALTLEEAGMTEVAAEQWNKAAELTSMKIEEVKKLVLDLRKEIYSGLYKEAENATLDN